MEASPACLALIKRFESFRAESYKCPAGIWTIGYGHTGGVEPGMAITETLAEQVLREDVADVEANLRPMLAGAKLTQGQYDALVSLAFNIGARRIPTTAPKFWKAVHSGDKQKAVVELVDINKANGVVLPGLTARRKAEAELFLKV